MNTDLAMNNVYVPKVNKFESDIQNFEQPRVVSKPVAKPSLKNWANKANYNLAQDGYFDYEDYEKPKIVS